MLEKIISMLTIEITNRCSLKCRMCSIWKEGQKMDLGIRQIEALLGSKKIAPALKCVSLTGGECFLHPDFEKLASLVRRLLYKGAIKQFCISTSGYETEKAIDFLSKSRACLGRISIDISLDGMKQCHNAQRGASDSYDRAVSTIMGIKKGFPEAALSVKMTIGRHNAGDIIPVFNFCRENRLRFLPKIIDADNPHYYHRSGREKDFLELTEGCKKRIRDSLLEIALSGSDLIDRDHLRTTVQMLSSGGKNACLTPALSLFVACSGEIHPCIYMGSIGNVNSPGWESKIFSREHTKLIDAGRSRECPSCIAYHGSLREFNLD